MLKALQLTYYFENYFIKKENYSKLFPVLHNLGLNRTQKKISGKSG